MNLRNISKAFLFASTFSLYGNLSAEECKEGPRFSCEDTTTFTTHAESVMNSMVELIQRSRELAIQSANGTLSTTDREFLEQEYSVLRNTNMALVTIYSKFTDTYQEIYDWMGNGISFRTLITLPGDLKIPVSFHLNALDQVILKNYQLSTLTSIDSAHAALNALDALMMALNSNRAVVGTLWNAKCPSK